MKSPPSLPKLSPPSLRCNVSARWKYKEAIVHGNIEDCTWEYKLGIKFIRNEGEGTLSRCNIGQEIARGKAIFKSHTLPVFLAITWTMIQWKLYYFAKENNLALLQKLKTLTIPNSLTLQENFVSIQFFSSRPSFPSIAVMEGNNAMFLCSQLGRFLF